MYSRAVRYRTNGNETNRKVLVTAQNQNSIRGFDISEMSTRQIMSLEKAWSKVQNLNIPLTEKEAQAIKTNRIAKTSFKSGDPGLYSLTGSLTAIGTLKNPLAISVRF